VKLRVPFEVFFRILDSEESLCKRIIPNVHSLALADQALFPDPLDVSFVPYLK
jgi:hypothetical protein